MKKGKGIKIPFHKPFLTKDEIPSVVECLKSGWLTMGHKTEEFENKFAGYIGSKNAVSLNSCTAALHVALAAIDLKEGDEVIVPDMTFSATAAVVTYFGARPVIVDVERETHNIDIKEIEKAVTGATKAVIPVDFGGQPCDMDEIVSLAREKNIKVIEDAAHALPASYKGRTVGTLADMTCFSFYVTKPLSTGEGGMMTTENDEWADRARILRLHGMSKDAYKRYSGHGSWFYEVTDAGFKYNMTDIQSSIGISQLKKVEWMRKEREKIAKKYSEAFSRECALTAPFVKSDRESSWHLYTIILDEKQLNISRNEFIEELKNKGIGSSVHFIPLHIHPYYRDKLGYAGKTFPNSQWIYERTISLPIYPGLSGGQTDEVVEAVLDICKKNKK